MVVTRKIDLSDLQQSIAKKKAEAEKQILKAKEKERVIRTRPRDPEEVKILDELSILKWQRAVADGKIRYIEKRKWYYEFD